MYRQRLDGFTLLELLITMAVAALLLTIAIPSYRSTVQRNTVSASVNDLVAALNYTRSQAVDRGRTVYICASTDQTHCSGRPEWDTGWIVYLASANASTVPGTRLRVHRPHGAELSIHAQSPAPLSFNSNGFAMNGTGFDVGTRDSAPTTHIAVAATGRVEARPVVSP